MFTRKEKLLPVAVLKPEPTKNTQSLEDEGVHLGEGYYWDPDPEDLSNGYIVAIGASGSGKTQTLKVINFSLHQTYPEIQVIFY